MSTGETIRPAAVAPDDSSNELESVDLSPSFDLDRALTAFDRVATLLATLDRRRSR